MHLQSRTCPNQSVTFFPLCTAGRLVTRLDTRDEIDSSPAGAIDLGRYLSTSLGSRSMSTAIGGSSIGGGGGGESGWSDDEDEEEEARLMSAGHHHARRTPKKKPQAGRKVIVVSSALVLHTGVLFGAS